MRALRDSVPIGLARQYGRDGPPGREAEEVLFARARIDLNLDRLRAHQPEDARGSATEEGIEGRRRRGAIWLVHVQIAHVFMVVVERELDVAIVAPGVKTRTVDPSPTATHSP